MDADLETALRLADIADAVTLRWWRPEGVASREKADGSPVTEADIAAEQAVLDAVLETCPGDGFLGEEVGERSGTTGRRWIIDGIDGTRFFAVGEPGWGTLIALERDGAIVVGVISSPALDRRWWAHNGGGAFTGRATTSAGATGIHVSTERSARPERIATLPGYSRLSLQHQDVVRTLARGVPVDRRWGQPAHVAEGEVDVSIWFCGDTWDHAAPSILVEEAGGRFSDHHGSGRLDTRTAVYSNGLVHDEVLAALADARSQAAL